MIHPGDKSLHPSTRRAGLLFRQGLVRDDDDRAATLLAVLFDVIEDYKTPPNKILTHDLSKLITVQVQHIVNCRQINMGMGNVIKFVKQRVTHLSPEMNEHESKQYLLGHMVTYYEERMVFSRQRITQICVDFIRPGDVILTFGPGSSNLLRQIFIETAKSKAFKLIIGIAKHVQPHLI